MESNALNTSLVFDNYFWDLESLWMITHFVAVFCAESDVTLLVFDNNFLDLEFFWMITHFGAVFCVLNNALNAW